jgi:nitrate/nitrite transporter NarK
MSEQSQGAALPGRDVRATRAAACNLVLATVSFALCFTAWSLIAPFAVGVPFVAGWYRRERQGFALGVFLGVGNGAVFKLVPGEFPENRAAAAGLLVFVGVCLALAVWLLRLAPPHKLRGVSTGLSA